MANIKIKPSDNQLITAFYSTTYFDIVRFHLDRDEILDIAKREIMAGLMKELEKKVVIIIEDNPECAMINSRAELYVFTPDEMREFISEIRANKYKL